MQKHIFNILIITLFVFGISSVNSTAADAQGEPYGKKSDYVGSETCGKCHLKAFKAWQKTKLARAIEVLGPRKAMKAKKSMSLDPYRDFTKDMNCLKCHTTGFKLNDDGTYAFAEYGIGCEVCHGAGKKYSRIMKIKGRNYKREELVKAGLNLDFEDTCLKCHNEESPLIDKEYIFSHKERYKGVHGIIDLKYHEKIERFLDEDEEETK